MLPPICPRSLAGAAQHFTRISGTGLCDKKPEGPTHWPPSRRGRGPACSWTLPIPLSRTSLVICSQTQAAGLFLPNCSGSLRLHFNTPCQSGQGPSSPLRDRRVNTVVSVQHRDVVMGRISATRGFHPGPAIIHVKKHKTPGCAAMTLRQRQNMEEEHVRAAQAPENEQAANKQSKASTH